MKLLDPASLAWLGLLPVLVAFYLMKLRRRRAEVSAVFLWKAAAREARVDSFFQKLKANLLLLLQILALLVLGLGLARPYSVVAGRVAEKVAVVVDVSASMKARDPEGQSRFERARKRALDLVDQAPRQTEITLAAMGRETRVVVPFTTDKEQLRRGLRSLSPGDVEEGREGARSLLVSLLTTQPNAEAYLLSDHPPAWEVPPRTSYLAHGSPGQNVAVSAFQVAPGNTPRDPLMVFAAVTSYQTGVVNFPLSLRRGGREVYRRDLTVPAGLRRTVVLPVPVKGPPDFELRLELEDDLAVDNTAWAVAPRQTPVRARVVGQGMRFATRALLSVPGVEAYGDGAPGQDYDLTLWTESPSTLGPGVHVVLVAGGGPARKGPFNLSGGDDPLVRELPLDRVWVREVHPLPVDAHTRVLARAGPHPAITLEQQPGRSVVRFGFDLYDSDLPLSPAFPILISRLVDQLVRGLLAAVPLEVTPGTALVLQTDQTARVELPDGRRVEVESNAGQGVLGETSQVGLYEVRLSSGSCFVAANLRSPQESDLRADPGQDRLSAVAEAGSGPAGQAGAGGQVTRSLMEEWWWELVAAALLVLMAEWFLYHRRPG